MTGGGRAAALVVAAALAGCGQRGDRTPARAAPGQDAAAAAPDAVASSEIRTVRIPDETRELVVAVTPSWDATTATMTHWRRGDVGWSQIGAPWPAVIGHAGAAWGDGVHGDGAPAGRPGPIKREGDGRAPAGMFAIGRSFGTATTAPAGTRMAYAPVDDHTTCVDDPASRYYGAVLDASTVRPDWGSAEVLRRYGTAYRWVVDVRHNADATPGQGSCIFWHVWAGPDDTTVGCTAMAEPALRALIAGLDPGARPLYVLLPAAEYAVLAPAWGLP